MGLLLESTLRLHGKFGGHFVRRVGGCVVGDGGGAGDASLGGCRVVCVGRGAGGGMSNFLVVVPKSGWARECVESVRWGWCDV